MATPVLTRLVSAFRTFAVEVIGTTALTADALVAGLFLVTIAATAIGTVTLNRTVEAFRTFTTESISAVTLVKLIVKTLAAQAIESATLTRVASAIRAMAASVISTPVLTRIASLFRTLQAAAIGTAVLTATSLQVVAAVAGDFIEVMVTQSKDLLARFPDTRDLLGRVTQIKDLLRRDPNKKGFRR